VVGVPINILLVGFDGYMDIRIKNWLNQDKKLAERLDIRTLVSIILLELE